MRISLIFFLRLLDSSSEGFRNWEFMTVHFWAETPNGTWTLEVKDTPSKLRNLEVLGKSCGPHIQTIIIIIIIIDLMSTGNLKEWTLILYGTSQSLYQDPTAPPPRSGELEIPEEPEEEEEEEKEYNGEKTDEVIKGVQSKTAPTFCLSI